MILDFERGSPKTPRGHALAYFRNASNQDEVYATYIIVPPVTIDLAKYMPPMFSDKISLADAESISAVPLPPVPEKVPGRRHLEQLAEIRDDDVIFLGSLDTSDNHRMLAQVAEASQEYLGVYTEYVTSLPSGEPAPDATAAIGDTVADVMYALMSDRDRLGELAKLAGKLRYAIDGADRTLEEETVAEMSALAGHFPGKYDIATVTQAARSPGQRGQRLSQLHIERCYKICDEDYLAAERLETEIRELESQP